MGFSVLPSNLDIAVQKGMLARRFEDALKAELGYRAAADRVVFPGKIGTTITRTRPGRLGQITTPVNPSTNVPLTNGLTPSSYGVEQYTTTVQLWAASADPLNLIDDETAIASIFLQNGENLGEQAFRSLDGLVLSTLQDAYLGGNTRVNATLGSAGATVSVDDIRGFQNVIVNGVMTPVSSSHTLPVQFNNGGTITTYQLQAATADGSNVSTAASVGGISGILNFTTSVSVANGTSGNAVVSQYAAPIIRPNGRVTTAALTSGDVFTLAAIRSAVTVLNNNAVPKIDGYYNCYIDPTSKEQLFADPEFQLLYRGTTLTGTPAYKNMMLITGLSVRFIETNQAPQQTIGNLSIHRPFICGAGVAIEDYFKKGSDAIIMKGTGAHPSLYNITTVNDVKMITRGQIDQLAQYINQAWAYVAGWCAPTDSTITSAVIKTASSAYYKRGVFVETA
jgi:hypothetical protein